MQQKVWLIQTNPWRGNKAVVKLQPGERYTEGKGHYSFIPPDNWELRDQDGYEFKIACGPRVDKIRPNIGFTSEATNTELAQFSSHTMTKSLNLDEKDLQKGVVKLDSGDDAIRIVGTVESNNHKFEMRGYFIKREGKVFMMMATLPENEKGLEEISDKCFQSLKFENP